MGASEQAMPQFADAGDLLGTLADKKQKREVSLSTLTKKQVDKIMASAIKCSQLAKDYYKETVEPKVAYRTDVYNSDAQHYQKKFPRLTEKSSWRSRDVQTAAEWLLPGLLEAFTGSDKPVSIKGANADDDVKAKSIEDIVTYQLDRKNSAYKLLKNSIEEALRSNFGIAKLWWKHEEEREAYEMLLSAEEMDKAMMLAMAVAQGSIEIRSAKPLEEAPDLIKVSYDTIKVTANYPVVEFLKPYEVRFTADGTNFQNTKFVAHRMIVTGDYLKRKEKEGVYKNVDKAIKQGGDISLTQLEQGKNNKLAQMRNAIVDNDDASTYVELMECYLDVDYNDDGILEKLIIHMVGDVPLKIEVNDYGFVPFYACCAYYDADKVFSDRSFVELIEQQQDLKTAIVKQMIINIAQQNAGQRIVDPSIVDVNALIDGDELVLTNDIGTGGTIANYVYPVPTPQLSPSTMALLEYAQNEVESQTGSTKYNQGLDSNSLNKTATGITAIMGAAEKRAKMIAREIAENYYKPLIKGVIVLDQKYMADEEIIRINDQNVTIRREDIDIDYDMNINVGEGAGTKEARINYLMILINQLLPNLMQNNIADNKMLYGASTRLLEEMGLKANILDMVDPTSPEGQAKAQQAQEAAMKQQQMILEQQQKQMQVELLKKVLPTTTLHYEDLPVGAQKAILDLLGVSVENEELIAKELLEDAKKNPSPRNNDGEFLPRPQDTAPKPSGARAQG